MGLFLLSLLVAAAAYAVLVFVLPADRDASLTPASVATVPQLWSRP